MIKLSEKQMIELLEYYRKKKHCSIQKFIENSFGIKICSENTYNKIKRSEEVRNKSDILSELFIRIGKPLIDFNGMIDFSKLHHAIEMDNTDTIRKESSLLLNAFVRLKDCAYFDFIYQCLLCVHDYYNGFIKDESELIQDYVEIGHLLNNQLQDIVSIVLLYLNARINTDSDNKINGALAFGKDYLPIHVFRYAQACHYEHILAIELGLGIERKMTDDNYQRRLNYLSFKLLLTQQLHGNTKEIENCILELLSSNDIKIYSKRRIQVMGNLIIVNILSKEYELALSNIDDILTKSKDRKYLFSIYRLFCERMLGKYDSTHDDSMDQSLSIDDTDKAMYEILININRDISLENRKLLHFCEKFLTKEDIVYLFMLEQIIERNCIALNRYKSYYDYKKLIESYT